MSKIFYTTGQMKELSQNKYVKSCSERYISFTKECKMEFINLHKQGIFYRDIFHQLGFPDYLVSSQLPERCSQRWQRSLKQHGLTGFDQKKGRRKKEKIDTSKMTKDEYINYLEAKIALIEELEKWKSGKYP